jgi:flagellar biosynthesis GTPase FlhF
MFLHPQTTQEEEKRKEKEEKAKQEKEEKAKQEKEEKAKLKEAESAKEDLALKEMTEATAKEEEELRKAKQHDKEKLCNISRALSVLASASVCSSLTCTFSVLAIHPNSISKMLSSVLSFLYHISNSYPCTAVC